MGIEEFMMMNSYKNKLIESRFLSRLCSFYSSDYFDPAIYLVSSITQRFHFYICNSYRPKPIPCQYTYTKFGFCLSVKSAKAVALTDSSSPSRNASRAFVFWRFSQMNIYRITTNKSTSKQLQTNRDPIPSRYPGACSLL